MMGLPEGHVTGVPISRNAMLKALGNGVVPQQAALALGILLHADYQSLPNTVAALLPTPSANEPGYTGSLVDEEGVPVAHTAQRAYDPDTGRLVQTGLPQAVALLPTPAVNDMGAGKTVDEWDSWTDRMKAEHGNGNGHGKSLAIEAQRIGGAA